MRVLLALCLLVTLIESARAQGDDCQFVEDRRQADNGRIVQACTRLIEQGGGNKEAMAQAYHARGNAKHALKRYDEAIADYGLALALRPGAATLYYDRGNALKEKGDAVGAIADFDQALALNPNLGLAYFGRAEALANRGERDRAVRDYEKVIALPATTRREQRALQVSLQKLTQLGVMSLGKRIALVIGNGKYQDQTALPNPPNDAQAMAGKLRQLGFQDVAEHYDVDLRAMSDAIKGFGDRAAEADWALIYYAGHGIEVAGVNYLLPIDVKLARETHVQDEAISLDRVLSKVGGARKLRLVILDACRNNPFSLRMVRSGGAMRSAGGGLADVEPSGGILVIYSAKHGRRSTAKGPTVHSPTRCSRTSTSPVSTSSPSSARCATVCSARRKTGRSRGCTARRAPSATSSR
jgi:tetratricopeptide (TPR) repeat protein